MGSGKGSGGVVTTLHTGLLLLLVLLVIVHAVLVITVLVAAYLFVMLNHVVGALTGVQGWW